MNNFTSPLLRTCVFLLFSALPYSAQAGENEIRQMLESKYPGKGKIGHIVKTQYSGLYEILIGDNLIYADERGEYLFDGSVIEVKSRVNLTEERHSQLIRIDFDKLPLDLAIKKVKGNGKRKLAIFTDPNCEYCKRLEKELAKVSDITLYLFIYPIFHGSDEIARDVRCAKDPAKAWDDLMLEGIAPVRSVCNTSTDNVLALGKKLNLKGTPNLIFANGARVPGYLSVEELEKRLNGIGH